MSESVLNLVFFATIFFPIPALIFHYTWGICFTFTVSVMCMHVKFNALMSLEVGLRAKQKSNIFFEVHYLNMVIKGKTSLFYE